MTSFLEEDRQDDDVARRRLAEARRDLDVVVGHVLEQDRLLLERRLSNEPLARREPIADVLPRAVGIAGDQLEIGAGCILIGDEERAVMRRHQRRQLAHDETRDGLEVLLPLHHPAELRQVGLQPVLLLVLLRRLAQVADHLVDVRLELIELALRVDGDLPRQVALGHRGRHVGDVPHLRRERVGHRVHRVGERLPRSGDPRHVGLTAELSFRTHFLRHSRHFVGEDPQTIHHVIDGVLEREHFALRLDGDLLRQVARRHRRGDVGDVSHLRRQVGGEAVHVVGQVAPDTGRAGHLRLSAELSFGSYFARHARHFAGEGVELVHHRVDSVLELENLPAYVDGDLSRQISSRHGRGHVGDVTHLHRQVAGHRVHVVGQILPRSTDARHARLPAQSSFGTHFSSDSRHFIGEDAELFHHVVDGVLQLQDFASYIDGDLLRQIAVGDRRRHQGDVPHLARQVRRQTVHVVGQVLPRPGNARHIRLPAEDPLGADLARHARYFAGERRELIDHRVDRLLEGEHFALGLDRDLPRQIALRHRRRHVGDVSHLVGQVAGHRVHVVGQVLPRSGDPGHVGLSAEDSLGAHLARHANHFAGERVQLIDHPVEHFLDLENLALRFGADLPRQVAVGDRRRHGAHVAQLHGEVRRHAVHVLGQIAPRSGDALDARLAAELSFRSYFLRHSRHFRGEGIELIDHRVDRVLQLEHLALHVHRDLPRQVAAGHGRRHVGDVTHLRREVAGHRVHVVGERLPRSGDARHVRLAAEHALRSHFLRDSRHFVGEDPELLHHVVDRVLQLQHLSLCFDRDLLRQVAVGDCGGDDGDVPHLIRQVRRHEVHVVRQILPRPTDARHLGLAAEDSARSYFARHANDFRRERIQLVHHRVDGVLELQHLALRLDRDLLRQVAVGDRRRHDRDVSHLAGEVRRHRVHAVRQILPRAADTLHHRLAAELTVRPHLSRDARHFAGEGVELIDHAIHGRSDAEEFALDLLALNLELDLLREIAFGDGLDDARDFARRLTQICYQPIDRFDRRRPRPADRADREPVAHVAFASDRVADANQLVGEPRPFISELIEGVDDLGHQRIAVRRQPHAEVAGVHRPHPREESMQRPLARRAAILGGASIGGDRDFHVRRHGRALLRAVLPSALRLGRGKIVVVATGGRIVLDVRIVADAHGQLRWKGCWSTSANLDCRPFESVLVRGGDAKPHVSRRVQRSSFLVRSQFKSGAGLGHCIWTSSLQVRRSRRAVSSRHQTQKPDTRGTRSRSPAWAVVLRTRVAIFTPICPPPPAASRSSFPPTLPTSPIPPGLA